MQLPSEILPGYGIVRCAPRVWTLDELLGKLIVWQPPLPQKGYRYVVSIDVASGIGKDRSVIEVTRVGTVREPAEQVAQYVDPWIDPTDLAYVIDAVGRLYSSADGLGALVAIEVVGLGLATQKELQQHVGYDNIYVWEYLDAADPAKVQTSKLGWETNRRSRPIIVGFYVKKVRSVGPDGRPDYLINSPFTVEEMRDFVVPPDGTGVWDACASGKDAYDDCIMAGAIGVFVATKTQYEFGESVDDKRRRLQEEQFRRHTEAQRTGSLRDFRNTDMTLEEMDAFEIEGETYSDGSEVDSFEYDRY